MSDVNELKNAASSEVTTIEGRLHALEVKTEGWVKIHVVYIVGVLCLIVGGLVGHIA